jgi:hypothetical protein
MLQEREFIKTGEPIYKIGRTSRDPDKRFAAYPKGSKVLLYIDSDDIFTHEMLLLSKFKTLFIQRKDIGAEYFEGDCTSMKIHLFQTVIPKEISPDPVTSIESVHKEIVDPRFPDLHLGADINHLSSVKEMANFLRPILKGRIKLDYESITYLLNGETVKVPIEKYFYKLLSKYYKEITKLYISCDDPTGDISNTYSILYRIFSSTEPTPSQWYKFRYYMLDILEAL